MKIGNAHHQPAPSTSRKGGGAPPPGPEDHFSLGGSLASGLVTAGGAAAVTLTQETKLLKQSLKTVWNSQILSPSLKVTALLVMPAVALCAPIVAPALGLIDGLWQGAGKKDAQEAISSSRERVQGLQDKVEQTQGWLMRVADKSAQTDDYGHLDKDHFLGLPELLLSPTQSWNKMQTW